MLEAVGSGGNVVVVDTLLVPLPTNDDGGRDATPTVSTGGAAALVDAHADAAEATTTPTGLTGAAP